MGKRKNLHVRDGRLEEALAGERCLVIDGAMGSLLLERGFSEASEHPELLNLSHPDAVTAIHRAYAGAGADIVTTNTFGANARKLDGAADVGEVYAAAVRCAREAGAPYVAADIGPTGELLAPYGELAFDEAYGLFAEAARAGAEAGCDLFIVETMTDLLEAKAAVLAVTENTDLPLIATMSFGEGGRTLMGTTPTVAAATLAQLGADVVGMNCSLGPDRAVGVARELVAASPVPVAVQPNAGLPVTDGGHLRYEIDATGFLASYHPVYEAGTRFLGSCCGSDPDFTRGLAALAAQGVPPVPISGANARATGSRSSVEIPAGGARAVSETVNPGGEMDPDEIADALSDCEEDIAAVDLSGVSGGDSEELEDLADAFAGFAQAPLWLQSDDPEVLEPLVRPYAGCPVVGTGTGPASERLSAFAARYGCPLA